MSRYDDHIPERTPAESDAIVRRQTETRAAELDRLMERAAPVPAAAPVPPGFTRCTKCGEARPPAAFGFTRTGNRSGTCLECFRAREREWRRERAGPRPVLPRDRVRWEDVVAAWQRGETLYTLAKVNGVSRQFIRARLKSLGIYRRRPALRRDVA